MSHGDVVTAKQMIGTGRPVLQTMIENVTGLRVISLHHDLSTVMGEEILVFTLAAAPAFRKAMKKQK